MDALQHIESIELLGDPGEARGLAVPADGISVHDAMLRPLRPDDLPHVNLSVAGLQLDALLIRVARGRSTLDLGIGQRLARLLDRGRLIDLGFSSLRDYAVECLGMGSRTAQMLVRLGRRVPELPELHAALESGELSARKAEVVLGVITAETDAAWTELARQHTVRRLQALVREARSADGSHDLTARESPGSSPCSEEQAWESPDRTAETETGAPASGQDGDGLRGPAPAPVPVPQPESPGLPPEPPIFANVEMPLSCSGGDTWRQALEMARKVCGQQGPRWILVEAIVQEFLGHALPQFEEQDLVALEELIEQAEDPAQAEKLRKRRQIADELKAHLEEVSHDWDFLPDEAFEVTLPHWARELPEAPFEIHEQLEALRDLRQRMDSYLGRLGRLFRQIGAWRAAGFASLAHYVSERLGMTPQTFLDHVRLDGHLQKHPELAEAYSSGRISYAKLRLILRLELREEPMRAWLQRAQELTCRQLDIEVAQAQDMLDARPCRALLPRLGPQAGAVKQGVDMCAASAEGSCEGSGVGGSDRASLEPTSTCEQVDGKPQCPALVPAQTGAFPRAPLRTLCFRGPAEIKALLLAAINAARRLAPEHDPAWPAPRDRALEQIARHFIEVWSQRPDEELPLEKQVIERDGYRCSVPGCSARGRLQAHHVWPRGRGGPDADWNLTACCMLHHLYGIHEGHLSVQGRAPDQLLWALGTRGEGPPLALFMGDVRVV